MIDPFTAFAMAQGAVKGIKAAMQLGKDVTGLYREFGTFFKSADAVHIASAKMRMDLVKLELNHYEIVISNKTIDAIQQCLGKFNQQ